MRHRRRRFQRARKQQRIELERAGESFSMLAALGGERRRRLWALTFVGVPRAYNFRWPPQTRDDTKNGAASPPRRI